jgi:hypothetical protein
MKIKDMIFQILGMTAENKTILVHDSNESSIVFKNIILMGSRYPNYSQTCPNSHLY